MYVRLICYSWYMMCIYIYILYYIIKYKLYSQNVLLLNQLSAFRASPEAEHVLCIEQIICSVEWQHMIFNSRIASGKFTFLWKIIILMVNSGHSHYYRSHSYSFSYGSVKGESFLTVHGFLASWLQGQGCAAVITCGAEGAPSRTGDINMGTK